MNASLDGGGPVGTAPPRTMHPAPTTMTARVGTVSPSSSSTSTASAGGTPKPNGAAGTPQDVCDECEDRPVAVVCEDCGLAYCPRCDKHRHRKGKLVFHQRQPLASSPHPLRTTSNDKEADVSTYVIENTPSAWDVEDVVKWLRGHELEVLSEEVRARRIDGAFLLSDAMEAFLEGQSTAARGHKKKLLREIQKLKSEHDPHQPPSQSPPHVASVGGERSPVPPPVLVNPAPMRTSLRRMGVNLRVNIDAQPAPAPEKHFSPVTAYRARATHGLTEDPRGRIQPRRSSRFAMSPEDDRASTPVVNVNTSEDRLRGHSAGASGSPSQLAPPSLQIDLSGMEIAAGGIDVSVPARDLRSIRQALGGLDLDMIKVKKDERSVEASFDFSAEGRLQTQGFEINTNGIANVPFPHPSHASKRSTMGTRECLLVLNELGHGASGKVYKALYVPTFKFVAIKVIRVFDQKKRHQMVRELKSLYVNYVPITDQFATAACDELVIFYDAFTNPEIGSVSIVLEYMDGGSLEDYMQSGKYSSERELANLAFCGLKGLAFLHENHQLHRDIKLSNMLVNRQGQVKISDFGISRDLESTLAKATTFTGTLLYMAPERISGGTYSYPSDIWSFGLAVMACAIGKLPVPTKEGYWGVVHAVQEQPSPKLADYGDHFSPELCDFLDQCLQKNPMHRPTASQLLDHPFIQGNYRPVLSSTEVEPLTDLEYKKRITELDHIAARVQSWCLEHADTLLSPTAAKPGAFHHLPHQDKIQVLAKQLRLPDNVVASKFAFMDKY